MLHVLNQRRKSWNKKSQIEMNGGIKHDVNLFKFHQIFFLLDFGSSNFATFFLRNPWLSSRPVTVAQYYLGAKNRAVFKGIRWTYYKCFIHFRSVNFLLKLYYCDDIKFCLFNITNSTTRVNNGLIAAVLCSHQFILLNR